MQFEHVQRSYLLRGNEVERGGAHVGRSGNGFYPGHSPVYFDVKACVNSHGNRTSYLHIGTILRRGIWGWVQAKLFVIWLFRPPFLRIRRLCWYFRFSLHYFFFLKRDPFHWRIGQKFTTVWYVLCHLVYILIANSDTMNHGLDILPSCRFFKLWQRFRAGHFTHDCPCRTFGRALVCFRDTIHGVSGPCVGNRGWVCRRIRISFREFFWLALVQSSVEQMTWLGPFELWFARRWLQFLFVGLGSLHLQHLHHDLSVQSDCDPLQGL